MRITSYNIKNSLIALSVFLIVVQTTLAQTAPARSPLRAITNTQYTEHTELFAEFRPLLLSVPARFTAHLTQIGESFKAYTDAEVTLTLTIDGKEAWKQTLTKPVANGIYRFPIKSETTGTGKVTIDLKMPTYSEQFIVENVTVYADEASALAIQNKLPVEERINEIAYTKEKSWLENFATAPVAKVKKNIIVPQSAILTENEKAYIYVQRDPEHFRKQEIKIGKSVNGTTKITSGLVLGDRIVILGADKIK